MASAIRWTRISWPRWPRMPPASGVALGFDRLVMLATGAPRYRRCALDPAFSLFLSSDPSSPRMPLCALGGGKSPSHGIFPPP